MLGPAAAFSTFSKWGTNPLYETTGLDYLQVATFGSGFEVACLIVTSK